ncbi:MAG: hypothetical protein PVG35_21870 [Desulfobacterales bacterium]|jgi:hypothetical protein
MKYKRFIITAVAVVLAAAIALLVTDRDQIETKPAKPTVSNESQPLPKTEEGTVQIAKKSPVQAAETSKPSEADTSTEMIIPEPVEGQMEPFEEDSGTEQLTAMVSENLEVDWDEAEKHPRLDDSMLSELQKEQIETAPVPVLLPEQQKLIDAALITTGPEWYAASMSEDDVSIYVSGVAKVVRAPGAEQYDPPAYGDHAHSLTRSEGIVEINFKAFGIYYTLSVECYDHENDTRCTQDDYAVELANELKLAPPENL